MVSDLLAALKNRWRLEFAVLLIVVALAALWAASVPKTYVATASLLFDPPQPAVDEHAAPQDDGSMLGTQADIIMSEALGAKVAEREKLAESANVVAKWRAETGGKENIHAWLGRGLIGGISVEPEKGTRVLNVSYSSSNPEWAAQMANAFVDTYIEERLRLQIDPAKTYAKWFADRTREVRSNLEQAQARLTAFQRRTGIVDNKSLDAEANRLTALSGLLTGAEAQEAGMRAHVDVAGSSAVSVQNSGVVAGLRSQVATKSAQLSELRENYGPNHPDVLAVTAELATLNSELGEEVGRASRTMRLESGAAITTAADLRSKLNSQRGRMLKLAADRSQLNILQQDVDSARAAYDSVTQRLRTMRLQSEVPTTNAHQLDHARTPLLPASPNVPVILLLGTVLGGLLAAGLTILLELWRPRVRTETGIIEYLGIPTIARVDLKKSEVRQYLIEGKAL